MAQEISVVTKSRSEMVDITSKVQGAVEAEGARDGLALVFVPHTTAGVTINENADPSVQRDILSSMDRIVPWDDDYTHDEGNSAAHIKASLFGSSASVIVEDGKLRLGTWQGIYFCEFDGPRRRKVWVTCR